MPSIRLALVIIAIWFMIRIILWELSWSPHATVRRQHFQRPLQKLHRKQHLEKNFTTPSLPNRMSASLAVLILACNRQKELDYALESWSEVRGIHKIPVIVSIDCNPGVSIDIAAWQARGLQQLSVNSSFQRHVVETGAQKVRTDERVTRHWLSAVSRALAQYEHVLYAEEDHVVMPSILQDVGPLLEAGKECTDCFAVQLGCHGDCWGMAIKDERAVGKMEQGNMGVVYSRDQWEAFGRDIHEYCSMYGIWDVNLHTFLQERQRRYALTYLSTRIAHLPTCQSARTGQFFDQNCRKQSQFLKKFKEISKKSNPIVGAQLVLEGKHDLPKSGVVHADTITQNRCIASYSANSSKDTFLAGITRLDLTKIWFTIITPFFKVTENDFARDRHVKSIIQKHPFFERFNASYHIDQSCCSILKKQNMTISAKYYSDEKGFGWVHTGKIGNWCSFLRFLDLCATKTSKTSCVWIENDVKVTEAMLEIIIQADETIRRGKEKHAILQPGNSFEVIIINQKLALDALKSFLNLKIDKPVDNEIWGRSKQKFLFHKTSVLKQTNHMSMAKTRDDSTIRCLNCSLVQIDSINLKCNLYPSTQRS